MYNSCLIEQSAIMSVGRYVARKFFYRRLVDSGAPIGNEAGVTFENLRGQGLCHDTFRCSIAPSLIFTVYMAELLVIFAQVPAVRVRIIVIRGHAISIFFV